jgi:hypothetical protein
MCLDNLTPQESTFTSLKGTWALEDIISIVVGLEGLGLLLKEVEKGQDPTYSIQGAPSLFSDLCTEPTFP